VAMGLLKEDDRYIVLTDIMGAEDHFGDMDFKVSGTGRGITAVQMDIKVKGISHEIMSKALEQARRGRLDILKTMIKAVSRPATQLSKYAPRLLITKIPPEKIGMVIGPGGKNIKRLQEETGATVEIQDDGTVHISSTQAGGAEAAKQRIDMMVAEVEVGRTYHGTVVSIKDFGAFIEILPGQEGLCHVSELSDQYVGRVSDVVKIGDQFDVKVIARDEQDRIKLSRKALLVGEGGGGGGGGGGERSGGGDRGERGGGDRGGRGYDRGGDRGQDRGGERAPDRGGDRGPEHRGERGGDRGAEGGERR
jgi:polyribonucleotide nucleotidyltransferase